jgi:hypothetical protein
MLDYAQWLRRAVAFIEGLRTLPGKMRIEIKVAPPLSAPELAKVEESSPLPIPEPLRQFWLRASRRCECTYHWDPPDRFAKQIDVAFPIRVPAHIVGGSRADAAWLEGSLRRTHISGGVTFDSPEDVIAHAHTFRDMAEDFRLDFPKDARYCGHSLPLVPFGNGDFLGLYLRDEVHDPPVAFICHDGYGGSGPFARSFADFLTQWEQVGYLWVELLLRHFINSRTGLLDVDAFPAGREAVQSLFRGEARPDLERSADVVTEDEWTSSASAGGLLMWLGEKGNLDERKLRLLACACCRRVWEQMGAWSRNAVEISERFADGLATFEELQSARTALCGGEAVRRQITISPESFDPGVWAEFMANPDKGLPMADMAPNFMAGLEQARAFSESEGPMHDAANSAVDASPLIFPTITCHFDDPMLGTECQAQADLVRHIFGNPFHPYTGPVPTQPAVVECALRLYRGEGFAADLQEALAGAGHLELAEHFSRPDHPKGCWALDLILGK